MRTGFGNSPRSDNYAANPFRLTVDARVTLGPPLEDEWLRVFEKGLQERGTARTVRYVQEQLVSIAEVYGRTEGFLLLRLQAQLELTKAQSELLRTIEEERRAFRQAAYLPVATSLVTGSPRVGSRELRRIYGDAVRQSLEHSWSVYQRLRDVLTVEQQSWLRTQRIAMQIFMTRADAERDWAGRQVLPR